VHEADRDQRADRLDQQRRPFDEIDLLAADQDARATGIERDVQII